MTVFDEPSSPRCRTDAVGGLGERHAAKSVLAAEPMPRPARRGPDLARLWPLRPSHSHRPVPWQSGTSPP